MTTIEEIIAKLEAETGQSREAILALEANLAKHRDLVTKNEAVLTVLRGALNGATAPAPAPVEAPAKEVREIPAPFPAYPKAGPAGFDRDAIKRQLKEWHVKYPLARSYRIPSALMRQALRAVILDHPGYKGDWLANGGVNLGDATVAHTMTDLYDAADVLGINADAIRFAAHKAQRLVDIYGTAGTDYLWEQKS